MSAFKISVRIYHEDTDGGGIVYYANYLRFMERARTEYLRSLGFEQDQLLESSKSLFVVTSCNISYLKPARFNETIVVTAEPLNWRRASMEFLQVVSRTDYFEGKSTEVVLCQANVQLACLDSQSFRPKAMPSELQRANR